MGTSSGGECTLITHFLAPRKMIRVVPDPQPGRGARTAQGKRGWDERLRRVGLVVLPDGEVIGCRNAALRLAPLHHADPLAAARHGGLALCHVRLKPLDQVRSVPAARADAMAPSSALARPRALIASDHENDRVQVGELAAPVDGAEAAELPLDVARSDPSARLRQKAVKLIGARRHPPAVSALAGVLASDPDPETRMEAARTLGRWKTTAAPPELRAAAADDPDERVRATATKVLRRMR
jgi:hypothetical protein